MLWCIRILYDFLAKCSNFRVEGRPNLDAKRKRRSIESNGSPFPLSYVPGFHCYDYDKCKSFVVEMDKIIKHRFLSVKLVENACKVICVRKKYVKPK